MKCEECGGKSGVYNSREVSNISGEKNIPKKYSDYKELTYRSHECKDCGHRFKSIEMTSNAFDELAREIKREMLASIGSLVESRDL